MYLLTHLYKTYPIISNTDWLANDKRFCEAYTPSDPIEVVWRQIDETVASANNVSTPSSPNQVVENADQLFFNTGVFAAGCWEWNKRAEAEKTLPRLKVFLPPPTGSGAFCFKTRRVPPTVPLTTPP